MIVQSELGKYLKQLTPLNNDLLREMEEAAKSDEVPIIDRPSIMLIRSFLMVKPNVSRILEVGTAIGYSTIWLAHAAPNAHVDTIERDEVRARQAKQYIARAGLEQRVTIHELDAKQFTPKQTYDVLFIDAAKGQYQTFFEAFTPLLNDSGLIITDNVFFHGHVLQAEDDIEPKRFRSMVKKLKAFNAWLSEHPQFETSFVPIGDGLAISQKKDVQNVQVRA